MILLLLLQLPALAHGSHKLLLMHCALVNPDSTSISTCTAAAASYNGAVAAVKQLWHVLVDTTWAWLATHVTQTNMSLLAAAALVCALVATAVKHQVCKHISSSTDDTAPRCGVQCSVSILLVAVDIYQ
jgi:hypothetical protein